jgi:hypothetical protein
LEGIFKSPVLECDPDALLKGSQHSNICVASLEMGFLSSERRDAWRHYQLRDEVDESILDIFHSLKYLRARWRRL